MNEGSVRREEEEGDEWVPRGAPPPPQRPPLPAYFCVSVCERRNKQPPISRESGGLRGLSTTSEWSHVTRWLCIHPSHKSKPPTHTARREALTP
jgi:hypothetical protein